MTLRESLQNDVEFHGEVHAILAEHDRELEIRQGQVHWGDPNGDMFTIESRTETYRFAYDDVISWYLPEDIWHD